MRTRISVVLVTFLLAGLFMAATSASFGSGPLSIISPDGNLKVEFELKANPQPYLPGVRAYYRISYKGIQALKDSPLGLDFVGARAMDRDFEITGSDRQSHNDTWEDAFNVQRRVPDHYNQLTIHLRERQAPNRQFDLIFRAFNEGVASKWTVADYEAKLIEGGLPPDGGRKWTGPIVLSLF
jgi:alpha-glucosidase